MDLRTKSTKEIGTLGERVAEEYLKRNRFSIIGRNIGKKTGELDLVAKKEGVLHFVEVKTLRCDELPVPPDSEGREAVNESYDPAENLHRYKIQKVARTAEWYVAETEWEGDWQVDGVLVWLREKDGMARVRYLPQIV